MQGGMAPAIKLKMAARSIRLSQLKWGISALRVNMCSVQQPDHLLRPERPRTALAGPSCPPQLMAARRQTAVPNGSQAANPTCWLSGYNMVSLGQLTDWTKHDWRDKLGRTHQITLGSFGRRFVRIRDSSTRSATSKSQTSHDLRRSRGYNPYIAEI